MMKLNLKFDFLAVFLAVGIIVLLLLSVNCNITQNEKNAELREAKNELALAVNEGTRLQIEIDKRSDFFSVEEYATRNLGMRKLADYQIQYLQYEVDDSAELLNTEEDEDFLGRVSKVFSVISDLFGN